MPHILRKAVLLAAGRGSRLGRLTAQTPKSLLLVNEKPILVHILDGLAAAGIEEAIVVTGYLASQVERACSDYCASPRPRITTVRQHELNGTGGAMLAAKPLLEGETHFAFAWADVLMARENYGPFIDQARSAEYDLMLAVNGTSDPYRGAAVYLDAAMRVERLIEKAAAGHLVDPLEQRGTVRFDAAPICLSSTTRAVVARGTRIAASDCRYD